MAKRVLLLLNPAGSLSTNKPGAIASLELRLISDINIVYVDNLLSSTPSDLLCFQNVCAEAIVMILVACGSKI